MITSVRFSTGDLPERERARAVRELRERGILPIEPLPDRAPDVRITKWLLPGASILSGTLAGLRQEARPEDMGGSDDVLFGLNLAGCSTAFQREGQITLGQGDAVFVNCAAGAIAIACPTPVRFVGLRVPRKSIAPLVTGVDDPAARLIPGETDALRLLTAYLTGIVNGNALACPDIARAVATHLHDLLALSVGANRDAAVAAQSRGVRAARLQAIKSDIGANLDDDALTVSAIAARHRVTPRYVHKLFESEGTTYTQFVLSRRLDRAHRMLRDPRLAARSISSIAYDVGFGDLSYFNRSFRRLYGATPSEVRQRGE